jgi:uncharacterized protein (DUF2147 family)
MYLVEANSAASRALDDQRAPGWTPSERWEDFPYSQLSHHGTACCDIAREWVLAMDFAQLNGADLSSGPRWLRARYKWGPSPWPMHWCKVVKLKSIDCGAHASLSREMFNARGLTAYPAQLVQRYSQDATGQWREKWGQEQVSCHWLDGEHIYHEATALMVGDEDVKIWDASSASWIDTAQSAAGYGSVVAVRILTGDAQGAFRWGSRALSPNVWNQLG